MLALLANYLNVSFSDREAFLPVSSLTGNLLARGRYSTRVYDEGRNITTIKTIEKHSSIKIETVLN